MCGTIKLRLKECNEIENAKEDMSIIDNSNKKIIRVIFRNLKNTFIGLAANNSRDWERKMGIGYERIGEIGWAT
jgi:hypothetical protein